MAKQRDASGKWIKGNDAALRHGRNIRFPLPRQATLGRSARARQAELLTGLRARYGEPTAAQTASCVSVAILETLLRILQALEDATVPETVLALTRLAAWLLHERDRRLVRLFGDVPATGPDAPFDLGQLLGAAGGPLPSGNPAPARRQDRPADAKPDAGPADAGPEVPELPADAGGDQGAQLQGGDRPAGQLSADAGQLAADQLSELLARFGSDNPEHDK